MIGDETKLSNTVTCWHRPGVFKMLTTKILRKSRYSA